MIYLFDLDGTLREPLSGSKFAQHPKDYKVIEGVYEQLDKVAWPEARLWGVSNQGGVAAGHKNLDDCFKEMAYTLQLIPALEGVAFCPDYDGRKLCVLNSRNVYAWNDSSSFYPDLIGSYRKPGTGMLEFVMRSLGSRDAVMVGDKPEDEQAAIAAGVGFVSAESWRSGV